MLPPSYSTSCLLPRPEHKSYRTSILDEIPPYQAPQRASALDYQAPDFPVQLFSGAHFGGSTRWFDIAHATTQHVANIGETFAALKRPAMSRSRAAFMSTACALGVLAHRASASQGVSQNAYEALLPELKNLYDGASTGLRIGLALSVLAEDVAAGPAHAGPLLVTGGAAAGALVSALLCAVMEQTADASGHMPSIVSAAFYGLLTGVEASKCTLYVAGKLMEAMGRQKQPENDLEMQQKGEASWAV